MGAWEENVRKVTPYTPGEQPKRQDIIKLNTNENPYPPAPGVGRILERFDPEELRLYPDPAACTLKEALAETYRVKTEQIFVGVGSDDVLAMAFMTFFNGEHPILFPDITYSFYPVWAGLFGVPYETVPLDREFRIRPEDYRRQNGGIIFPNPNAPTGLFLPLDQVEEILKNNPDSVVIVDEAYVDFGGTSALPLIDQYENLLVVQTFSKSRSMAGMRIGYAFGSRKLIAAMENVKYSYNSYTMNQAALCLGTAAVEDEAYFKDTLRRIIRTREETKVWLKELGFSFPDSMANFIFASHEKADAEELYQALKEERIYVRYFKKPVLDRYLRITIGTDQEMAALHDFLKRYLGR